MRPLKSSSETCAAKDHAEHMVSSAVQDTILTIRGSFGLAIEPLPNGMGRWARLLPGGGRFGAKFEVHFLICLGARQGGRGMGDFFASGGEGNQSKPAG